MSENSYKPGDLIVYGSNGICIIEDIKEKRFASDKTEKLYYILKPANNLTSTLFVPLDSDTLRAKMRDIITREEIEALLTRAKTHEFKWIDDRNERLSRFHEILKNAAQQELVPMIGCLYIKKRALAENGKKLSTTDCNILASAEKMVREEFSHALSIPQEAVGSYIEAALES